MKLEGKVAIITGGASGIGEATAKLFSGEGASVVVADFSEKGQEVADSLIGEAIFVITDVSKEEDIKDLIQSTVDKFGRVDIMFANAGIGDATPAHELSIDDWQKMIDVNLTGVFLSNKHAIKQMLKQDGGGSIVNNASILGHVGQEGITSYTAAKGGVVNLTRSLAVTYAKNGIRVNAVCPGYIDTPLLKEAPDELKQQLVSLHPIGRLGKAEEVAKAVLFLSSDDASFVTGANLLVDGGYTAQ
ncbi:NAD(P)-dependent dehydrogenase (short-subunit alcohol dehydrogenase family) [Melghiribacillus thermohalophilus]|uniref:NAD(P)-dependent dehydrogenase (Short-subunit alcohol dehydrogenase family) n=1 Tax=Melghiribacillus thermohalophilus TaxID=1324956 RepID=A0A4R3NBP4_9BACI|nr:glucose 1-dehydrogenase [Melghiribacillus thermohalophilus]TCT26864.1 NAD(P)-dependent dehydrogenase (short-subunit alcohol dehydrogenase family) [Melghiribacillus thermohalophilus]